MKTLYDIGDKIEIRLKGVIIEHNMSVHRDSYLIDIETPTDKISQDIKISLSEDYLKECSHKN